MALAVTYTNFGGQLVSEDRGGAKSDYVSDTLGSTIALMDKSGEVTDTWSYWPYGEVAEHNGGSETPFTFVGTLGYFKDLASSLTYVRARFYQAFTGQWMTKDPLWPNQFSYAYVQSDPIGHIDPSGQIWIHILCAASCIAAIGLALGMYIACEKWEGAYDSPGECILDYLSTLPAGSIVGCSVGLAGCIACVIRYLMNALKKSKDKICKILYASYDTICPGISQKRNDPRRCQDCDPCAKNVLKTARYLICIGLRSASIALGCDKSPAHKKTHEKTIETYSKFLPECWEAVRVSCLGGGECGA